LALLLGIDVLSAAEAVRKSIRFGLTAAVVRENLDLYDRWAAYLGRKIGQPVQFEQRRSYREAIELIESGEHDFSWICSLPYAKYRDSKSFSLLAVPVFDGEPVYRAYIIVNKDSAFRLFSELEGKVFAFSDPDSNSGYLVPQRMLRDLGKNPDSFFRHSFFTYSHTETIEAVAERVADGAAVDSYVWEYLSRRQPALTARTKIIQRSQSYGFPPIVVRAAVDADVRHKMLSALLGMDGDTEGRLLLEELLLDRFVIAPSSLYDGVRANLDQP
jgi:phosphonate transport system substrate-binding protein